MVFRMQNQIAAFSLVLGLLGLGASARAQGHFPLAYAHEDVAGIREALELDATISLAPNPKERLAAEPDYTSERPMYGAIDLGNGTDTTFTIALDESTGTEGGYDRLYFDTNNNEDLTDDPDVLVEKLEGKRPKAPAVEALLDDAEPGRPHHLEIVVCGTREKPHLHVQAIGFRHGTLTLGRSSYRAALVDVNDNGRFDDPFTLGTKSLELGDLLLLDLNADGRFVEAEACALGKTLSTQERCWDLAVPADGSYISLAAHPGPAGTISSRNGFFSGILMGPLGAVTLHAGADRIEVPAGTYRCMLGNLERRDEAGEVWQIRSRAESTFKQFNVPEAEITPVPCGEPLILTALATKNGQRYSFGLDLRGHGDEAYYPRIWREGHPIVPPRLIIRDMQGKVVAQEKFRYG